MTEPDQYLLGYSEAEQDRLERQALELAEDSASLFRQVGLPLRAVSLPVWLTGRAGRCSPSRVRRSRLGTAVDSALCRCITGGGESPGDGG
jgi:outer membrane biogenesis lipoprotein LolB